MSPLTDSGPLRADSARVRAQMLAAARARIGEGDLDLPMNAIAKAAGVGVGTAYRHFPTRQALLEALAVQSLAALVADAVAGAADPDPAVGFTALLRNGLRLLRDDPTLAAVLSSTEPPCLATTTDLNAQLGGAVQTILERARAEGVIRPDVTADDIRRLICGVQHAVAAGQGDDAADRYLDILLAGLRP
ncbi:TetR/AcrR family transcriptional regulator [Dactylosporangium sp. NPDC051541]|uniref:TetR/AcrR family transcriptional regulator n=1 Tax=Dactylosporangium sp. NPDC051541 TaxID=3363977 RepID=UPI003792C38B